MGKSPTKSMIQDLIAHAGSYGYQRPNRFAVFINGPRFRGTDYATHVKRLALTCVGTNFPGRRIGTQDVTIYNVPSKIPNREIFEQELNLQFNCSSDMYEAMYFKYWQDMVMDPRTNSPNFYDNFAKPFTVTIIALPNSVTDYDQLAGVFLDNPESQANRSYAPAASLSSYDHEQTIYYRKCLECYPIEIVATPLNSAPGNSVMTLNVTMAFKKWVDPIELYFTERYKEAQSRAIGYAESSPNSWEYNNIVNKYEVTQTKYIEPVDPPWIRFRKFVRDIVRISNPNEFRRVVTDRAVDILGDQYGIENVEAAAGAGQVIDVFRRNPEPTIPNVRDNLLSRITNLGL